MIRRSLAWIARQAHDLWPLFVAGTALLTAGGTDRWYVWLPLCGLAGGIWGWAEVRAEREGYQRGLAAGALTLFAMGVSADDLKQIGDDLRSRS